MISLLPPELKEHIYSFCQPPDLLNVAFCSKDLYASVKGSLWKQVKLPWRMLAKRKLPDMARNLKYTCNLCVCNSRGNAIKSNNNNNNTNNNNNNYNNNNNNNSSRQRDDTLYTLQSFDQGKYNSDAFLSVVSDNYAKLLSHCNAHKLRKLHITGLPIQLDIKQTADVLKNIRELSLAGTESFNFDWSHLTRLRHLRKLSFERCDGINDDSVAKITQCERLEELTFKVCVSMRDAALRSIGTLRNLKKLSIVSNTFITCAAFKELHQLQTLDHLHVESTLINDESLQHLSQTLTRLTVLKLIGCCKISDAGFTKMERLQCLLELDIKMCWRITGQCFQVRVYLSKGEQIDFKPTDRSELFYVSVASDTV